MKKESRSLLIIGGSTLGFLLILFLATLFTGFIPGTRWHYAKQPLDLKEQHYVQIKVEKAKNDLRVFKNTVEWKLSDTVLDNSEEFRLIERYSELVTKKYEEVWERSEIRRRKDLKESVNEISNLILDLSRQIRYHDYMNITKDEELEKKLKALESEAKKLSDESFTKLTSK